MIEGLSQQDTKKHLNRRGTQIRVFPRVKRGVINGEVKRRKGVTAGTAPEGERGGGNEGKRVGGKGPESTLEKNSEFDTSML